MRCSTKARETLVSSLRREVAKLEMSRPLEDERPVSTGSPILDGLLPAGGLRRGTLVEYLTVGIGNGAGTLALGAAREACSDGRALVVVERRSEVRGQKSGVDGGRFYPLAAAALGIDLAAVLVLRPASEADAVWAIDQALRCRGVGAVWAACERLDVRDFRRWQLAAESGGTVGLFIRPARLRGQPTWAEVQWHINPRSTVHGPKFKVQGSRFKVRKISNMTSRLSPWQLDIELVRCRGAAGGQKVLLELDEAAGVWREVSDEAARSLSVFAGVADPTAARRA